MYRGWLTITLSSSETCIPSRSKIRTKVDSSSIFATDITSVSVVHAILRSSIHVGREEEEEEEEEEEVEVEEVESDDAESEGARVIWQEY